MHRYRFLIGTSFLCSSICGPTWAQPSSPSDSTVFHASFDQSPDAEKSKGDHHIYTAESLERKKIQLGLHTDAVEWKKGEGRNGGGCLHFKQKTDQLVFFKGGANLPYSKSAFHGTLSMWMRLSPQEDLPKGYVDPLQITDKKWNDASFFVDFDSAEARDFRLGVFSDLKFWNPTNRNFDDIPNSERPMVFVKSPPFDREKWTHVVFTWDKFNTSEDAVATLYLDGKSQGTIRGKQQVTWDAEKAVIMLGINYVGWIDDITILDRAISPSEIQSLGE